MSQQLLESLIKQADGLTTDELLNLAGQLVEKARKSQMNGRPRHKWREIAGIAPDLLEGEDAQAWVTRTRRESDEARARQWEQRG